MISETNIFLTLLIANAFAFALFSYDKKAAILRYYRIKNKLLIIIGYLGPIGALLSTKTLRHKTKKFKKYLKKYAYVALVQVGFLTIVFIYNYFF